MEISNSDVHNVSCFGAEDGEIFIDVINGSPPYSYLWNNGNIEVELFNLGPGEYSVEITDSDDCILRRNFIVTEPNTIQVSIVVDQSADFAIANVSGGTAPYSIDWSDGSEGVILNNITIGSTYRVTITDTNGCNHEDEFVIEPITNTFDVSFVNDIDIFPNPSSGLFNISFESKLTIEDLNLKIYTSLGENILIQNLNFGQISQVDLSDFPQGTYFVQLTDGANYFIDRIIIAR